MKHSILKYVEFHENNAEAKKYSNQQTHLKRRKLSHKQPNFTSEGNRKRSKAQS